MAAIAIGRVPPTVATARDLPTRRYLETHLDVRDVDHI